MREFQVWLPFVFMPPDKRCLGIAIINSQALPGQMPQRKTEDLPAVLGREGYLFSESDKSFNLARIHPPLPIRRASATKTPALVDVTSPHHVGQASSVCHHAQWP